ncbi:MAG: hypothetical protein L0Y54_04135 [Sporichthyaceae bacterium]|nr:hypothetical protein [Sporichthyaceae bacterium]
MRSVSHFTPGPGGVMTDEVGVVTGELTLETALSDDGGDGRVLLRVQYRDADEWYTVTGGCFMVDGPARAEELHQAALELLTKGGQDLAALELAGVKPCSE